MGELNCAIACWMSRARSFAICRRFGACRCNVHAPSRLSPLLPSTFTAAAGGFWIAKQALLVPVGKQPIFAHFVYVRLIVLTRVVSPLMRRVDFCRLQIDSIRD